MASDVTHRAVVRRLLWSRALRSFADGYVSVLLPIYLIALGLKTLQVGFITTVALFGSGLLTLAVGVGASRYPYGTLLLLAAILMAGTGVAFAHLSDFVPLLCIAFVGTLNPSRGDVSLFVPIEHALLTRHTADAERTSAFATYSLVGSLVAAAGALFAGLPEILARELGIDSLRALKAMFVLYAALGIGSALIYAGLPKTEHRAKTGEAAPLRRSKTMVYKLTALFSLDAFGSGFIVDSMIALWLYQKYELSVAVAGTIFLAIGVLSAFSYPLAVRIARRFGLVNTMVFTHLPSSVFLILVPLMPSVEWAIAMLLIRSTLSQMDVPTRNSYVMAIVPPEERPAAASITVVPKSFTSALAPALVGYLLTESSFGAHFVIAGTLKIVYDLLLLYTCRKVQPPEEAHRR